MSDSDFASHAAVGGVAMLRAPYVRIAFLAVVGALLVLAGFCLSAIPKLFSAKAAPAAANGAIAGPSGTLSGQVRLGKPGPWGLMQYLPIGMEFPDELVVVAPQDDQPIRWFFKGYTKDRALEFLRSAELSSSQFDSIEKASWTADGDGAWVTPGDDWILGLSPASRAKIYNLLVEYPENSTPIEPICFKVVDLERRLKASGLQESSLKLFRKLLYPRDSSLWLFADTQLAIRRLPDDNQRRSLVKMTSWNPAILAQLKINKDSDLNTLVSYWSVGGRRNDVALLLDSLQDVEGGCNLNIVCLLPPFMRDRLYTYPRPSVRPGDPVQDCFWTVFNVFNEQLDNQVVDKAYRQRLFDTEYYNIPQPSQLGDIILLATRSNKALHAAVYVADDIVFTKNGILAGQPWLLMHYEDMLNTYTVRYPTSGLTAFCYRRKSL
jgi:hypothetical protein